MTALEISNLKQAMLAEKPNVIISRVGSPPLALASRVKVDGTEVVRLMISQYTEFYLEPGEHEIIMSFNPLSGQKGAMKSLNIEEDKRYYLDIGGSLNKPTPEAALAYLDRCCEKIEIQPR
ncbi:MAG: hypothetical protein ABJN69_14320 [Hellea sp.]